jgi:hypothetical protein
MDGGEFLEDVGRKSARKGLEELESDDEVGKDCCWFVGIFVELRRS